MSERGRYGEERCQKLLCRRERGLHGRERSLRKRREKSWNHRENMIAIVRELMPDEIYRCVVTCSV